MSGRARNHKKNLLHLAAAAARGLPSPRLFQEQPGSVAAQVDLVMVGEVLHVRVLHHVLNVILLGPVFRVATSPPALPLPIESPLSSIILRTS